jgi:predicted dehydrogenase
MPDKQQKTVSFAIIGCGLIGKKRATALSNLKGAKLMAVCDLDFARAYELSRGYTNCDAVTDPSDIFTRSDIDAVIISSINGTLAPLSQQAALAGKHVLVEKPGAITSAELRAVNEAARQTGVKIRLGYNHRYHPALQKAREILDSGVMGPLMFLRGRYGHGGRKGYDREWRANPQLSGGGELIDQGVHLIDLAGWILGDFTTIEGHAATYYWDMKVDDNAFLSLRTAEGMTAWLHVSCTEWKNMFSLEIYGREGKLAIEGLGGSYGVERIAYYKMLPQMGPPDTTIWEYPAGDVSWTAETQAFLDDIVYDRTPSPSLDEGITTLQIVENIYRSSGYLGS